MALGVVTGGLGPLGSTPMTPQSSVARLIDHGRLVLLGPDCWMTTTLPFEHGSANPMLEAVARGDFVAAAAYVVQKPCEGDRWEGNLCRFKEPPATTADPIVSWTETEGLTLLTLPPVQVYEWLGIGPDPMPDLVGASEIARRLRVTQQAMQYHLGRPGAPDPYRRSAKRKEWRWSQVEKWALDSRAAAFRQFKSEPRVEYPPAWVRG